MQDGAQSMLAPNDTAEQWAEFEHALAAFVEVLDTGQFLIIETRPPGTGRGTSPYVQLAVHDGGVYAEAVSNHFLSAHDRLDPRERRRLLVLGWTAPRRTPHESNVSSTTDGSTNYSRDYAEPIDATSIASDLVAALREVYAVHRPRDLEYNAFAERPSAMIVIPTLGIRRTRSEENSLPEPSFDAPDLDDDLTNARRPAATAGYL